MEAKESQQDSPKITCSKLEHGIRMIIYTWKHIAASADPDEFSIKVNVRAMRDVKYLFDTTQYDFTRIRLTELIEILVKELTLFVEETEGVGQQDIEDFLWIFMFEIFNVYIELEENPDKDFFVTASLITQLYQTLENGNEDIYEKVVKEKKQSFDLMMKEFNRNNLSSKNLDEDLFEGEHGDSHSSHSNISSEEEKDMFKKREGGRKKKKKNPGFVDLMAEVKEEMDKEDEDDDDDMPKPTFTMPTGGNWSTAK